MYSRELKEINNSHTQRVIYDENLLDLASNDYLGLSSKKQLLTRAIARVNMFKHHSPKGSLLVNGYHQIHKDFEEFLCRQTGFEDAIVTGSNFLANMVLMEVLPKKGDLLIIDKEYYVDKGLISKFDDVEVVFFKHNSSEDLENILKNSKYKRAIIAVAGIYSISGEILNKEIFNIADTYENTLLIVDESHSIGVIGENFTGVFDLYKIAVKPNYITVGTLGSAYGSSGGYILASKQIVELLQSSSEVLLDTTAPSLIDIELAHQGMFYIFKNKQSLHVEIKKRKDLIKKHFGVDIKGLIFTYEMNSSQDVLDTQMKLQNKGFLVRAICPPKVKKSVLRISVSLDVTLEDLERLFDVYM